MASRRITVFLKHLSVGGLERIMVQLANGFARRGHSVDLVVAKTGGPLEAEVDAAVRIVELGSRRMWAALPNLMRYLKKERPDALLVAGVQVNVIALWARMLGSVPCRLVLSVHSNMTEYSGNADVWYARVNPMAIKLFYRLADAVVTVSGGVRDDLADISERAAANGHVVYNPVVDEALITKSRETLSHPWFADDPDVPVLLGVGRMDALKNFDLLLKAFARVRCRREARLVLLGDGRDRPDLEQLARTLEIADAVDFVGFVDNPYKYMANASLLVVSSRLEGFGMVLVEAMACGCPVVSTDCPSGPREILEDGKWGRLVPVGDEKALAEAMDGALTESHDLNRLRDRADDFSVDQAVDGYLEILFPAGDRIRQETPV